MALSPTITTAEVKALGSLTPSLFLVADSASLDTIVQASIDYADARFASLAGDNYGLTTPTWAPVLQRRGVMYLALAALGDTLKAQKIYGTHAPYQSEDSPAYEALIDNEWLARAKEALERWVTLDGPGTGFAKPVFLVTDPTPIIEDDTNGLDALNVLYEEVLARSRGRSNPELGTVFR